MTTNPLSTTTGGQPKEPAADGLIHDPDRQQMMFCSACGGHTMHSRSQAWRPDKPWRVTQYKTVCMTCSRPRDRLPWGETA